MQEEAKRELRDPCSGCPLADAEKTSGRIGALKSCWPGGKKVVLLHRSGRVALVDGGTIWR